MRHGDPEGTEEACLVDVDHAEHDFGAAVLLHLTWPLHLTQRKIQSKIRHQGESRGPVEREKPRGNYSIMYLVSCCGVEERALQ